MKSIFENEKTNLLQSINRLSKITKDDLCSKVYRIQYGNELAIRKIENARLEMIENLSNYINQLRDI